MIAGVGVVERAFQLAATSTCKSLTDVQRRLRAEGYLDVEGHLDGPEIRKQLSRACRAPSPDAPSAPKQ